MKKELVPENILEKIKKLLNLAQGSDILGESNAAMAAANKLLLKYNLDLSQIEQSDSSNKILQEIYEADKFETRHEAGWSKKLFFTIAKFNMCQVLELIKKRHPHDLGQIVVIGLKHNIDMVYYMADFALTHIRIAEKDHWNKYDGNVKRNSYRRSFFIGAIEGVHKKLQLQEEQTANEKVWQGTTAGENHIEEVKQMGIMIVNNKALINDFVKNNYNNLAANRNTSYSGKDARQEGRSFGSNLNFNKAMGQNRNSGQLN